MPLQKQTVFNEKKLEVASKEQIHWVEKR